MGPHEQDLKGQYNDTDFLLSTKFDLVSMSVANPKYPGYPHFRSMIFYRWKSSCNSNYTSLLSTITVTLKDGFLCSHLPSQPTTFLLHSPVLPHCICRACLDWEFHVLRLEVMYVICYSCGLKKVSQS